MRGPRLRGPRHPDGLQPAPPGSPRSVPTKTPRKRELVTAFLSASRLPGSVSNGVSFRCYKAPAAGELYGVVFEVERGPTAYLFTGSSHRCRQGRSGRLVSEALPWCPFSLHLPQGHRVPAIPRATGATRAPCGQLFHNVSHETKFLEFLRRARRSHEGNLPCLGHRL